MENEQHELKARVLAIPIELFKDKRVSANDKFLVVVIDMLDGDDFCYASNSYLGELLDQPENTIANRLSKLRKLGWVKYAPQGAGDRRRLTTPLGDARRAMQSILKNGIEAEMPHINSDEAVTDFGKGVTNSGKAVTKIGNGGYQNRQEAVTNFGKPLIKGLNSREENKREKEEAHSQGGITLEDIIQVFQRYYPEFTPAPLQQNELEVEITDLERWDTTVKFWALSGYSPRSIPKIINCYKTGAFEMKAAAEETGTLWGKDPYTGEVIRGPQDLKIHHPKSSFKAKVSELPPGDPAGWLSMPAHFVEEVMARTRGHSQSTQPTDTTPACDPSAQPPETSGS